MTKTKRQLRAEAVERLRKTTCPSAWQIVDALFGDSAMAYSSQRVRDDIIDLLTDEPDGERSPENGDGNEPRNGAICGNPTKNGDSGAECGPSLPEVRVGPSRSELPEGDAVELLRHFANYTLNPNLETGESLELHYIADMVERDYIPRDEYDDAAGLCHRYAKEICELRAERDEWQNAYDDWQLQTEGLVAERDALREKANRYQGQIFELVGAAGYDYEVGMTVKEISEGACERIKEILAERDELQAKCDRQRKEITRLHKAADEDSKRIMRAECERDEWKAKAEQVADGNRYIARPVDEDGEPWLVGDKVDTVQGIGTVDAIVWDGYNWYLNIDSSEWEQQITAMAKVCRHHHEPTLEDVLSELAEKVWDISCTCQTTWSDSGLDGIESDYADRIRELMGRAENG